MFAHSISLAVAETIVDEVLRQGRERGFQPLTVVVLDAGGHIKAMKRDDGASLMRPEICMGKAWGALALGFGGRELARRAEKMSMFMNAASDLAGGRMVPVPGGILIKDATGTIIGAVGITGDTSDNDEICGVEAVKAAGLTPDTGDAL
jgi:uncharacterized protein GlcG (DUF336 family)